MVSEKPYGVRAAPLSGSDIIDGRHEYQRLLTVIADAQKTGEYRSYDNPDMWRRPAWKRQPRQVAVAGELIQL